MRILVIGCGAIGSYIGGSLELAGHAVTFVEKPGTAMELRQRGLRLHLHSREAHLPDPRVVDSIPAALEKGEYDGGIFALKAYDNQEALQNLQPYREELPPLLCLQNGVENESVLAAALGEAKVIAGCVTSAISRIAVGEVRLERLRGCGIAAGHPLSERLADTFNEAGLNARLYPSAAAMKWSKMLTNLLANATSAILDMRPAEIFSHPGLFRLEIEQLREALRVMHALQIHVVDLPGTPVRALAFAVQSLPAALSRPVLRRAVGGGRGEKMPSFYLDLKSSKGKSEVEFLNGAVVRLGAQVGVATPVNRLLTEVLSAMVRGEIPLEAYARRPEKLLKAWRTSRLAGASKRE